jgi:hypothetical protein
MRERERERESQLQDYIIDNLKSRKKEKEKKIKLFNFFNSFLQNSHYSLSQFNLYVYKLVTVNLAHL